MARKAKPPAGKSVDALRHQEATRRNIPPAEYQSVIQKAAEQANSASPVFSELHALVLQTSGLADVLREALTPVSGRIR
jgi:hypothetical protein